MRSFVEYCSALFSLLFSWVRLRWAAVNSDGWFHMRVRCAQRRVAMQFEALMRISRRVMGLAMAAVARSYPDWQARTHYELGQTPDAVFP